jgi:hypothetical protein
VGEVWMQNTSQMAYWQKTALLVKFKTTIQPSIGHGLYTSRCIGKVFNEDDGSWDKGMIKVYDNFTNDYL